MLAAQAFGHYVAVGFRNGEFDVHGFDAGFGLSNEVGQREISVGTGNKIGMMTFEKFLLYAFSHTAQNAYDETAAFPAQSVEGFKTVYDLLLRIVAHGTGVEEYGIGLIKCFTRFVACHTHDRGHHLAVSNIHLAAVGFYVKMFHYRR